MKYFLYQLIIYIVFIAVSKNQAGENKPARTTVLASVIGLVFLVISYFVEFPLRVIPYTILLENEWLYLTVVLATDLAKIAIPFCAVLGMSALFGNTKISKFVIVISLTVVIVSFAMVTYETLSFIKVYNHIIGGELPFFTVLTGGPMSPGFGRIMLILELVPAVLQTFVTFAKR